MAKITNKIDIPFAQDGDKTPLLDTSATGLVNRTHGFTERYSQPPSEGGAYIDRETFNQVIFETQNAIKELQQLIITSIGVGNKKPDNEGNVKLNFTDLSDTLNLSNKVNNILSVANGGTGADNLFYISNVVTFSELRKILNIEQTEHVSISTIYSKLEQNSSVTFNFDLNELSEIPERISYGIITIVKTPLVFDEDMGYALIKSPKFTTINTPTNGIFNVNKWQFLFSSSAYIPTVFTFGNSYSTPISSTISEVQSLDVDLMFNVISTASNGHTRGIFVNVVGSFIIQGPPSLYNKIIIKHNIKPYTEITVSISNANTDETNKIIAKTNLYSNELILDTSRYNPGSQSLKYIISYTYYSTDSLGNFEEKNVINSIRVEN